MSRKPQRVLEDLKIHTLGAKGKAIGKTEEGRIVFIPYVAPGDIVDARVVKKRKNYLEAEAISIKSESKHRVEPQCEHFTRCGGCKWQHLQYDQQLIYKQNEVLENLRRIGEIIPERIEPILASETIYHYRNSTSMKTGKDYPGPSRYVMGLSAANVLAISGAASFGNSDQRC